MEAKDRYASGALGLPHRENHLISRKGADAITSAPSLRPVLDRLLIQERPQLARPTWMLKLTQRLCLNLADTFTRNAELLADFF